MIRDNCRITSTLRLTERSLVDERLSLFDAGLELFDSAIHQIVLI